MRQVIRMGVEGELGKKNFSTYAIDKIEGKYGGIHGYGKTAREAIEDTYVAIGEMKSLAKEENENFPDFDVAFVFDVGSLFSYYPYLNISAVAEKMHINASLMRKYASGISRPSKKRLSEIQNCIAEISTELHNVNLG